MPSERLSAEPNGRLTVGDRELHAGDGLEILVAGHWVPARVEWDGSRWYAVVPQGEAEMALHVLLRPGLTARLPGKKG